MADARKNQGLAKRVRAAEVAAGIVAYDAAGNASTTAKTKTDRFALARRLRKLESTVGLAATGAAKIRNNGMGFENRIRAILALLSILLVFMLPASAKADTYGNALVRYEASAPSGGCTNRHLWWNTVTDVLSICENNVWVTGSGPGTGFPLTAVSGGNTVSLVGTPASHITSLSISDSTTGAGFNASNGTDAGASVFAYNEDFSYSDGVTLSDEQTTRTFSSSDETSLTVEHLGTGTYNLSASTTSGARTNSFSLNGSTAVSALGVEDSLGGSSSLTINAPSKTALLTVDDATTGGAFNAAAGASPVSTLSAYDASHNSSFTVKPARLDAQLSGGGALAFTDPKLDVTSSLAGGSALPFYDMDSSGSGMSLGSNNGVDLVTGAKVALHCDNNSEAAVMLCDVGSSIKASNSSNSISSGNFAGNMGVVLTESSATTVAVADVALAAGGTFRYCVLSYVSGSSMQMRCGHFDWQAVNISSTATIVMNPTAPDQTNDSSALAASSGTLTYGWTVDTATANKVKFKLNAVSSLSQVILEVFWNVETNPAIPVRMP